MLLASRLLDLPDDAAGARAPRARRARRSGSTRTATSTRPTRRRRGFLGGMCLAGACGRWDAGFGGPGLDPTRVVMAACATSTRRARPARARRRGALSAGPTASGRAARRAVFVHLDLDVLDPTVLPAQFPAPGGLRPDGLRGCSPGSPAPRDRRRRGHRVRGARRRAARRADRRAAARGGRTFTADAKPRARCCARSSRTSHERRAQRAARRRRGEDRPPARARQADRARADRAAGRRGHVHRARHPRRQPHFSVSARWRASEAPADGVITGYGKVDGRLVAVCAYDFTVMAGSMGMTGEIKVARLRELALTKRIPFVWLLDSAGARIQEAVGSLFAGSGHLFREEVVMSGVDPAGRGADGPVRGGHRLHPGAGRLRADGQGPRLDGARRARTSCARRSARTSRRRSSAARACTAASPASATSRSPTTRSASSASSSTSRTSRRTARSAPPVLPVERSGRPHGRGAARRPAGLQPQALRHVRGDPADRRRRRVARPQAAVGAARSSPASRAWAAGRSGIVANQPKQLGGILDNDSADKAARFVNLCDAFGIPLVFLHGRARLHGRHEGRGGRHHPPRREDAARGRRRDGAEGHGRAAQGLRRRLLRDERPGVRARPDRRLAERRDLRDGRRGRGRDRLPQAGRGGRGPGGQEGAS